MLKAFTSFIDQHSLCTKEKRVLLAVSGGLDSMVMADLFYRAGFKFSIVHCNFQLREEESFGDEEFVRSYARKLDIPFISKRFDTREFCAENKTGIQEGARALRYTWFSELMEEKGFDVCAIAHHIDDSNETFLINLIRGAGLKGLGGIKAKNGRYIRPLLFTNRKEIEAYAHQMNIEWREDSSNEHDVYLRNNIRKHLMPILTGINPAIKETLSATAGKMLDAEEIIRQYIYEHSSELYSEDGRVFKINLKALKECKGVLTVLFFLLEPKGFNADQCKDILSVIDPPSGKVFLSPTHRLIIDRQALLVTHVSVPEPETKFISSQGLDSEELSVTVIFTEEKETLERFGRTNSVFDADRLKFPLKVRKWEKGDYFYPLGFGKRQKISDFFVNNRFSLLDKEQTWLVLSGEDIIWVVGHRIDDRYKVTPSTKRRCILEIKLN